MPVLELTHLKVKAGLSSSDPSILHSLREVRTLLTEKVHPTNSRFYVSLSDPSDIYILGSWPFVEAHTAFLASADLKTQILGPQEETLQFQWGIHVPIKKCLETDVPLDAPVLAIGRLFINSEEGRKEGYQRIVDKYRYLLEEATKPWVVYEGWRTDAPEGEPETVVVTGWKSEEEHGQWRKELRETNEEYRGIGENIRGVDLVHVKDLEALFPDVG